MAVEAKVSCVTPLKGFQGALDVSGGTAGTLTLESITIDGERSDYLFHGQSDVTGEDEANGRAAGALFSGAVSAPGTKYLATYTFRASNDVAGTFLITVNTPGTLLRGESQQEVPWQPGPTVTVNIRE